MRRTEEQIHALQIKSLECLTEILTKDGNILVPQTDQVIDMIFCFFLQNSMESIPKERRMDYLEMRLQELSAKTARTIFGLLDVDCMDCKNGTHAKTIHFNA